MSPRPTDRTEHEEQAWLDSIAEIEHACEVLEAVCVDCGSPLTPGDRDICWACARDNALATGAIEDYGR